LPVVPICRKATGNYKFRSLGKPKRLRLTGDIVTPVSDGKRVA
jgi:hypothetical protein